jgi:hypothetical protein
MTLEASVTDNAALITAQGYIIEQVVLNKSSLLLQIDLSKTKTILMVGSKPCPEILDYGRLIVANALPFGFQLLLSLSDMI